VEEESDETLYWLELLVEAESMVSIMQGYMQDV
jgi:hypothetical protein